MIVVCVGVKERTKSLIDNLVASMNMCVGKEGLWLSVFECGGHSAGEIHRRWSGGFIYGHSGGFFSRAYTLNRAISQSKHRSDLVFICDADMSLPVDFVEQFHENVSAARSWFPVCYSQTKREGGWWRNGGFGMVGIHRGNFPGFNETFKTWGGEDNDLYDRVKTTKIRKRCRGLVHRYHFSENNLRVMPGVLGCTENENRMIMAITTYNRIEFLKKCIGSWRKTRNRSYEWVLVIADDGSTDGTEEYIKSLKVPGVVAIKILQNNRTGIHYQTNTILQYCSKIGFEYGFSVDDDVEFLKRGWDDAYIRGIEKLVMITCVSTIWGGREWALTVFPFAQNMPKVRFGLFQERS